MFLSGGHALQWIRTPSSVTWNRNRRSSVVSGWASSHAARGSARTRSRIVEESEEEIEDLRRRLFHLVEDEDTERMPPDCLQPPGQLGITRAEEAIGRPRPLALTDAQARGVCDVILMGSGQFPLM